MRTLWHLVLLILKSRTFHLIVAGFLVLNCTSDALSGIALRDRRIQAAVGNFGWGLTSWEVNALQEKFGAMIERPAAKLSDAEGAQLVEAYLDRANKIGDNQREINKLLSNNDEQNASERESKIKALQTEIDTLRDQQQQVRVTVEAVIEGQISWAIENAGIDWQGYVLPPVQFTFTEPPKKLIVSPRDRIAIIYGQMIDASMPLAKLEELEATLKNQQNLSGYVTGIGGLGAYPTLVVDQASLYWILSTVAHEWTHNYLSFFPLGFNYGVNADNITMNETTAEIVGNELGRVALLRFYRDRINSEVYPDLPIKDEIPQHKPPEFDFRREMQETRKVVDQLLHYHRIGDAETYMEARRMLFVENGYNLRVLNQAYFAFHGSYGTSAAVSFSDPITPRIFELRKLSGSLYAFVKAIRGITTLEQLQQTVKSTQ